MKKLFLSFLAASAAAFALADAPVDLLDGRAYALSIEQPYASADGNLANLFNGNKLDRCIWVKPNPGTGVIPRGTIALTDGDMTVNAYRMYSSTSGNLATGRLPKDWTLYARNAGDAEWTVLDTQSGVNDWVVESYKDFSFRNTKPYSEFMLEITANNGDSRLVGLAELEFYQLAQEDLLEIGYTGYKVGLPSPAYGPIENLEAGTNLSLTVASPRHVDSATGELYLLDSFTLTDFSGNVLASGTAADLPYGYTHAGHAKMYWNWTSQSEALLDSLEDQTVPAKALVNEISAARSDNGTTAAKAFDNNIEQSGRWLSKPPSSTGEPNWIQYRFLDGKRVITGFKMNQAGSDQKGRLPKTFIFQGSNDGENFTDLLSVNVPSPATSVENIRFSVPNATAYEYYRLYITAGGATDWLEIGEIELYSHLSADTLRVTGTPGAYGDPEPGYGYHTNLVGGTTCAFSAPSAQIAVSDDEKTVASAYRLSVNGVEGQVVEATSGSYTHTAGDYAVLEWIFSGTCRQVFTTSGGGNVNQSECWAAEGQSVTVLATSGNNGAPFVMWSGDLPDGVDATDPALVYTVDRPRHIVANFATPLYVKPDGDDAADGTSEATALATLPCALSRAANGGIVYVMPGTYSVPGDTLVLDKALDVVATDADPENTVVELEADGSGSLLSISHAKAHVSGLTFRGATDTGLKMTAGALANCVVEDCATTANGGGLQLDGGTVTNCVFRNNTANGFAGGVLIPAGTAPIVFDDNVITGNVAKTALSDDCCAGGIAISRAITANRLLVTGNTGSGAYLRGATVFDSVFADNTGWRGAGAYLDSKARVERSIFRGNRASIYGGGAFMESGTLVNDLFTGNSGPGGGIFSRSNTTVINCTFLDNTSGGSATDSIRIADPFTCRNSLISGSINGINNSMDVVTNFIRQTSHCCFADFDLATELATGTNIATDNPKVGADGRIRAASSPLVDAGDNGTWTADDVDLYGNPRIHRFGEKHGVVDIGCCESEFTPSTSTLIFIL